MMIRNLQDIPAVQHNKQGYLPVWHNDKSHIPVNSQIADKCYPEYQFLLGNNIAVKVNFVLQNSSAPPLGSCSLFN